MNYLVKVAIILIFIAGMIPVILNSESSNVQGHICDEKVYYSEDAYLSVAQMHERLVSLSWPDIPPVARNARISANAVFQIKVTATGEVCSVVPIGGSPIMIPPLELEIKNWKFQPGEKFWGLIAIRYVSSREFRLL